LTRAIGYAFAFLLILSSTTALGRDKAIGPLEFLVGATTLLSMLAIGALRRRKDDRGISTAGNRTWTR